MSCHKHPLCCFLLMLFGMAPDTPCGLMMYSGADGPQSCAALLLPGGATTSTLGLSLLQKPVREHWTEPSRARMFCGTLSCCSKNMKATESNLKLSGERLGLLAFQQGSVIRKPRHSHQKAFLKKTVIIAVLCHERTLYSPVGKA